MAQRSMIERRIMDCYIRLKIVKLLKMSVFLEIDVTALRRPKPSLDDHVSSPNDTFKVCLKDHQLKCGPRIFAKMLLIIDKQLTFFLNIAY